MDDQSHFSPSVWRVSFSTLDLLLGFWSLFYALQVPLGLWISAQSLTVCLPFTWAVWFHPFKIPRLETSVFLIHFHLMSGLFHNVHIMIPDPKSTLKPGWGETMIFYPLYLINSTSDSNCHEETNRLIKESKVAPLHQATTPCRAFERWLAGSRRRILMYYWQEMAPLCSSRLTSLLSMLLQVKNTQSGGEERGPTN